LREFILTRGSIVREHLFKEIIILITSFRIYIYTYIYYIYIYTHICEVKTFTSKIVLIDTRTRSLIVYS
jgi:hypothetical protein